MNPTEYRRTPLPKGASTPLGWFALCFMGLIFSPFVGFAIAGKVAAPGLIFGLLFAVLPLSGLTFIAVSRWLVWRRLPPDIAEEWKSGRVVPAIGAPTVIAPVRFANKMDRIEILPDGVVVSRYSLLMMQGVSEGMGKHWIAEQTGELFFPWTDITEWGVETDSDGPNFYLLMLRPKGMLRIRRFQPDSATECDILDAVRYVGRLPVRLSCDVDCKR
ncbi:hypothetical protein [Methylosoma difficile]